MGQKIGLEIERKFIITEFPPLKAEEVAFYEQSYLFVTDDTEVRIRKKTCGDSTNYKMTTKWGQGMIRQEAEVDIPMEMYQILLAQVAGRPITKQYRKYRYLGFVIECSIVDNGQASSYMYAEVEGSIVVVLAFESPIEWGWKEVTNQPNMGMKDYWQRTRLNK